MHSVSFESQSQPADDEVSSYLISLTTDENAQCRLIRYTANSTEFSWKKSDHELPFLNKPSSWLFHRKIPRGNPRRVQFSQARPEPDPYTQVLCSDGRDPSGWTMPRGRPQASWLRQVGSYLRDMGMAGLASV